MTPVGTLQRLNLSKQFLDSGLQLFLSGLLDLRHLFMACQYGLNLDSEFLFDTDDVVVFFSLEFLDHLSIHIDLFV